RFSQENGSDPFLFPFHPPLLKGQSSKLDFAKHVPPSPGNCRRRGLWVCGVSAAWMPRPSPQGRVYGVPANPQSPASPQYNPEP
ncbi:hypothetical protein D7T60_11835, partial [Stenotrophomonas maltophilia]|nr:hypothetical protein [Stenotrophomonas maltophilia]